MLSIINTEEDIRHFLSSHFDDASGKITAHLFEALGIDV